MPQHEVLAFGSGTGNIPYVLSFGNRGPCRTTSNRQHQNGITDSWREAWHGTKGSQIKLTVKQVTSASPGLSAVPRPSGPANPTIPSMPPIVTKSLEQKHRGLPTEQLPKIRSKWPYRKACKMATLGAQPCQELDSPFHHRSRYRRCGMHCGLRRHGRENIAENARTECH